jgi:hypothetical protein
MIPELERTTHALYVIRLGSSYGVEDTKMLQAGFETASVFDSARASMRRTKVTAPCAVAPTR